MVINAGVYLLEHDGTLKWGPKTASGVTGLGGPPTIADLDGDGLPEIGVAFANRFVVFDMTEARNGQARSRTTVQVSTARQFSTLKETGSRKSCSVTRFYWRLLRCRRRCRFQIAD